MKVKKCNYLQWGDLDSPKKKFNSTKTSDIEPYKAAIIRNLVNQMRPKEKQQIRLSKLMCNGKCNI